MCCAGPLRDMCVVCVSLWREHAWLALICRVGWLHGHTQVLAWHRHMAVQAVGVLL